jgi:hypothetical protein
MCPFADNCVFGDKCRFNHSDVLGFQPSYPFASKKGGNILRGQQYRPEEKIPISALTKKLIIPVTLQ